jgi:hypothetical protein
MVADRKQKALTAEDAKNAEEKPQSKKLLPLIRTDHTDSEKIKKLFTADLRG